MATICDNRKAFHDYFIEERLEAGVELLGWEVKSIRAGKVQIAEAHIISRSGELFCVGAHIAPLVQAGTHIPTDPLRTRKILARKAEIDRLTSRRDIAGYALIALNLHWSHGKIKLELGVAKGKKLHDKRASLKEREGDREIARAMKAKPKTGAL